jgi:hypothetical protein
MTSSGGQQLVRRLAPWAVVLLVGGLMSGILPVAQAATGASPGDAIPVGTDGKFSGIDQPTRSTWYRFTYVANTQATITVTYEPPDSNRMDIFVFTPTSDPNSPRQEGVSSTRTNNALSITFSDPSSREVLIKVENDHTDRTVSFVGMVAPPTALATPVATPTGVTPTPITTPTPGPVAISASNALTIDQTGLFLGTLTNQAVWYRFYYKNAGLDATVTVNLAPAADRNTALNLYTGTDLSALTQQTTPATQNGNTLSRTVNLPAEQFVFFTVVNNNSSQVIAYSGSVSPAVAPPGGTPTATTTIATAVPATPTVAPTAVPAPAPQVPHDSRYFGDTGYRIDDDAIYAYFQARGQLDTFGFPVSRTFRFLGCQVQVFQRQVAQNCGGTTGVHLMNVLDPEIFPYTRVNGSIFPGPDDGLKQRTPPVSSPTYATDILQFVRQVAQDQFQGQPTNFGQTFFGSVSATQAGTTDPNLIGLFDLEIWGAPISQPQPDPGNANFIYQRFQRGIMHYTAPGAGPGTIPGTRGILLADYLKQIILGPTLPGGGPNQTLPPDLAQQAQGSKYFAQYCPGGIRWECRPNDLTDTDLTFAFERG